MPKTTVRICITDALGVVRKVALVGPTSTGFFATCPYHKARRGQFYRARVPNGRRTQFIPVGALYEASSRAKLSFHFPDKDHPDSFMVQFSGPGIVSGFGPKGIARGLALKGPPLEEISTGPTFGIQTWGLQDFDQARERDDNRLELPESSIYMYPRENNGTYNCYHLEFFLWPDKLRKAKRQHPDFYKTYHYEGKTIGFYFKVIDLPLHRRFLGVTCVRRQVSFESPSGYIFNSPRLLDWMISGTYPPVFADAPITSIDHDPNP